MKRCHNRGAEALVEKIQQSPEPEEDKLYPFGADTSKLKLQQGRLRGEGDLQFAELGLLNGELQRPKKRRLSGVLRAISIKSK